MTAKTFLTASCMAMLLLSSCITAHAQEPPPVHPIEDEAAPDSGHIYLYLHGELMQAQRDISGGGQMVEFALLELLKGPTQEEEEAGYVTFIPDGVKLQYTTVKQDRSEFSVNLSRELLELSGDPDSSVKALTQVVKTAQEVSGITEIGITVAGEAMGDPPQDAFEALGVSREQAGISGPGADEPGSAGRVGLVLGIVFSSLGAAILAFLLFYLLRRKRSEAKEGEANKRTGSGKASGRGAG